MRIVKYSVTGRPWQGCIFILAGSLIAGFSAAAEPCPATFRAFAEKFEGNAAFRKAQTSDPLSYAWRDKANYPDGELMQGSLSRAEVAVRQESLFPFSFADKALPRGRRVSRAGAAVGLFLFVPESDALQFQYTFIRSKKCWLLTRVEDVSL